MRNRAASLTVLAALSLITSQVARAQQQPSAGVSSGKTDDEKCQKFIVVNGAVRAPGHLKVWDDMNLAQVLAMVGGVTERAGRIVQITHSALGSGCDESARAASDKPVERTEVYDLQDVRHGKANPLLLPGDVVTVSGAAMIYVTGRVLTPRAIIPKAPTTITQAIAAVGGVQPDALIERVKIYRRLYGNSSNAEIIVVDLRAIKKKRAEDIVLQPYDIVEVPCKSCRGDNFGRLDLGRVIY
jgi:protein involved in polysaccharide export with SLBB domain